MEVRVYSLRDVKAGVYLPGLMTFRKEEESSRFFIGMLHNQGSNLHKFPRDYQLHEVGKFDDEAGTLGFQIPRDVTPYTAIEAFEKGVK